MYLEDDAQHAEFPGDNGAFTLTNNRYKVCGDEDNQSSSASSPPTPPPVWNTPISWQSQRGGRMPFPTNSHGKQLVGRPNYESAYFKRSIPLVSLSLNKTGKNIVIENPPDENVFVKVPESVLSVDAILAEVGKKTSLLPSDLVLLDSKVLVVSDDKGQCELCLTFHTFAFSFIQKWTTGGPLQENCVLPKPLNSMIFQGK